MKKEIKDKKLIRVKEKKVDINTINKLRLENDLPKITKCYNCQKKFNNMEKVFYATEEDTEKVVLICENCKNKFLGIGKSFEEKSK